MKLRHPAALASYRLPDCDLLLLPEHAEAFGRLARSRGWSVTSWGEAWEPGQALGGRWYLRAVRGPLQVDATYECPFIDVAASMASAEWVDGVAVCPEEGVWTLKVIKDRTAACGFAERFGLRIPEASLRRAAEHVQL